MIQQIIYKANVIGAPRPLKWYEFESVSEHLTLEYTFDSTNEQFIIEEISRRIQNDYKISGQLITIFDWEIEKHWVEIDDLNRGIARYKRIKKYLSDEVTKYDYSN